MLPKWENGPFAMGQRCGGEVDHIQKTSHSWWKKKGRISQIDDHAKHIFRKHNQEADCLTNLGTEGWRKITVEKGTNTEKWKAVRGFWDGSKRLMEEAVVVL